MLTNIRLHLGARAMALAIFSSLALAASAPTFAAAEYAGAGASVTAPLVADIDATCNAFAASKTLKSYALTRVTANPKARGNWRLASAKSNAAISNRQGEWFADFATVTASDQQPVYATVYSSDSTGDGGTGHEYCYASGKLVRTIVDVDDISEDQTWKHYTYYASDGSLLTSRTVYRYLGRGAHTQSSAADGLFALPKYSTPSALPFYSAYRKAVAGSLPVL